MHLFRAPTEEGKCSRMLSLRIQERFGPPALWPAFGKSAISSGARSGKSLLPSSWGRTQQLRYALQFASAKSCRCTRVASSGGSGCGLHSWPYPVTGRRQSSVFPACAIEPAGGRVPSAPEAVKRRLRAPDMGTSRFGKAGAGVVCRAWPNPPVNLTRNGVRQSAGKVSCVHSSSPAACRTPLRSGYRQR
jgi:hypothetical protein